MKRLRRAVFRLVMAGTLSVSPAAPQSVSSQFKATARFLALTPGFVEWPPETFKSPSAPLDICVRGDFSFGTTLAEATRSENLNGHRFQVRWARNEVDLAQCQMLFVSRSEAKRYDKVLNTVKNSITLTIGEDPEFLAVGGMLSLQSANNGVRFDVNLDAVKNGHLKLSSQLLSLARHVIRNSDGTKG